MSGYPSVLVLFLAWHLIGLGALHLILPRGRRLAAEAWLPLSFALGAGLYAWLILVVMVAARRILPGIVPGAVAVSLSAALAAEGGPKAFFARWGGFEFYRLPGSMSAADARFYFILAAALFAVLSIQLFDNTGYPLTGYDARAIWSYKAMILFHENTIFSDAVLNLDRVHYHRDYPLLMPILERAAYAALGGVDERRMKLIFFWFFLMLAAWFYHELRARSGAFAAIFMTLLLVCAGHWSGRREGAINFGGVDLPFLFFTTLSALSGARWMRTREGHELAICAAGAAFALLTKNEGAVFCAALAGGLVLANLASARREGLRPLLASLGALAAIAVIFIPMFLIKREIPNPYDEKFSSMMTLENLPRFHLRIPIIALRFWEYVSEIADWNLAWFAYAGAAALGAARWIKERDIFLDAVVLLWLGAVLAIYLFTPLNVDFHLKTSLERLLSQIFPLAVFQIGVFAGRVAGELAPPRAA